YCVKVGAFWGCTSATHTWVWSNVRRRHIRIKHVSFAHLGLELWFPRMRFKFLTNCPAGALKCGISLRQGPHQVAQIFRMTGLPCPSSVLSSMRLPSSILSLIFLDILGAEAIQFRFQSLSHLARMNFLFNY